MKPFPLIAILALTAVASSANSATLSPGKAAPELDVKTWYKGTPVKSFDKNKTYVVEFWATWCGPCRESIPHLSELAKKNKDVTFIGVSVWEDDNGKNIADFVKQMGDKMDYNVGYSGNQTGMAKTWMAAAGQNGIPAAFVIKDNKVQWIGHPMTLEGPLGEIKAGTFDEAGFQKQFNQRQEAAEQQAAIGRDIQDCAKMYTDGKKGEARTKLDEIVKKYPAAAMQAEPLQFTWLAKDDPKEWEVKAKALAASKDQQKELELCNFAMSQARMPTGDHAIARKAIEIGLEATSHNDVLVLFFASDVYSALKEYKLALDSANTLLKVIPDSQYKGQTQLIDEVKAKVKDLETKVKA